MKMIRRDFRQALKTELNPMIQKHNRRNGAMLVFVAVALVILFVAAAFAIDIAYMHATRAELRTASDAAARAGSEALGRLQNTDKAIQAAIDVAGENDVAGAPLILARDDIELGSNKRLRNGKYRFVPGGKPINSIRVVARRTADSRSGAVPLFFGPMLGRSEFEPVQQATATRLDRDIALVLDVSGSMRSQGRFAALTNALNVFIDELEILAGEEVVSLSVYSTSARKLVPMTDHLYRIRRAFQSQRPSGRTAIGEGLRVGLDSILNDSEARPFALKEIIIMTDGNHNQGINPLRVVPQAVAEDVTVHTITFSRGANQNLMRRVAQAGNGIHLHANSNQQLVDVFREIALQIPVVLID